MIDLFLRFVLLPSCVVGFLLFVLLRLHIEAVLLEIILIFVLAVLLLLLEVFLCLPFFS